MTPISMFAAPETLLTDGRRETRLAALASASALRCDPADLVGRSVLISTREQITACLALVELHGVARRMIVCPPDFPHDGLADVVNRAAIDTIVVDAGTEALAPPMNVRRVLCDTDLRPVAARPLHSHETEWVLFTSGTTGPPKMVGHDLTGLTGAIRRAPQSTDRVVWSTFYDLRRYGGLQIFLRAAIGGATLVIGRAGEPLPEFLARQAAHGTTHVSGTPSHWRRVLMSPDARVIAPRYVRLSGEIADQAVLDRLRAVYPDAGISHAYASTEAGVGFHVDDGREGFPAALLGRHGDVEMVIVDGSLRIRSPRAARAYVGGGSVALTDADGFVDSGDMVDVRGDRVHFVGRRDGVVNVGGLKVHPEEVEAVINRHPRVRMSLVHARRNPITGALVAADIVLESNCDDVITTAETDTVRQDIIATCRAVLAPHKVPASVRFVRALSVSPTGKLARRHE